MKSEVIKKVANHGVAWEAGYGYVQAIQVKDTIYLSGQLSHDGEGNFVAAAALDDAGRPADYSQMENQFRQTYVNAKKLLAEFGASLDDVVEEAVFVLDMPAGFAAAAKVRKEMYGRDVPQCASSIFVVSALAQPVQLVEVAFRAVVARP
ncbi:RidA family protein [Xanthobacter tagetidis]|uniref:RidA family protein n=1 Tax=Xanthobacter tagetidis TaxID=60216 RepID=A0A3L7AGW0_9HYPH|nr:Rid family hydrolase [Xanthobacter tagetidis]MBB6308583.1 enamine deaminase RidA (YjgF/YER057c/UK114 family) [Xanthobacter tagetidis]RLP78652.1 RidA family protein [Xanthobacter tagetidis]